jgi:hypothetical protein
MVRLRGDRQDVRGALVKLNSGFSGEGNSVFRFPADSSSDPALLRGRIRSSLDRLGLL